ncbi:MAG: hypothetical protein KKA19_05785 [Candidatus Margulisbacteria bacterium]|nr:hypothetical protein [Candidatus Margulisiibacteriota bacterium]
MKIIKYFLIVSSLVLLLSAVITADEGATGYRLFKEGLYPEARQAFNRAWQKYPTQANYTEYIKACEKMIKAQNLFEQTVYQESLKLTEEVAKLMPEDEKIQIFVKQRKRAVQIKEEIDLNFKRGDPKKVLQGYEDLLDLNPLDKRAARAIDAYRQYFNQLDKARQYFRRGEWEKSLNIYKKAWSLMPNDFLLEKTISKNILALTLQEQYQAGKYKEAANGFAELLKEYSEMNIFQEKMDQAERASRLNISMRIAYAEGDPDKAQAIAKRLLELNPKDELALNYLKKSEPVLKALRQGDTYLLAQEYLKAKVEYQEALKVDPENNLLRERLRLVEIIVEQRKYRNDKFSNTTLAKYNTFSKLYEYVSNYAKKYGNVANEVELVEKIVAWRNSGINLFYAGDYAAAIENFNKVLQVNARDNVAQRFREKAKLALKYREKIRILYKAAKQNEAQEAYQTLIIINPEEKSFQQIIEE